jgi:hypothetical protein
MWRRSCHPRTFSSLAATAILVVLTTMVVLPYELCPSYNFPAPSPFHGAQLYNPYANVGSRWLKVNLHAHARAWHGLTAGRETPVDLLRRYRALGYDAAAVSTYEQVDTTLGSLDVYEQGYGIQKTHLLVVGAHAVDWLDFPFFETVDAKQYRIERLRRDADLVILAHPHLRHGFTMHDLQRLGDYDAIEVASDFGNGEAEWDAALSAGRLAWAVGDDDTHDAGNPQLVGHAWTMLAARSASTHDVAAAIRAGEDYAVVGRAGRADVALDRITVVGDTIDLALTGSPATIEWIGRDDRVLAEFPSATHARFALNANEPFARAVVQTATTRLILNPVVRTDGARPRMVAVAPREGMHVVVAGVR